MRNEIDRILAKVIRKEISECNAIDELYTLFDVSGSSLSAFLDYEIRSSWWASWIGFDYGQELAGKYFAWKAKRKYNRYLKSKMWERRIKNCR
jgi:hypothetical protein